ncbi:multicopper oxidase family protein [Corynebacterium hadale]|uniref:multicopper oxidase family protein n=1 Tax=Corynebacterium hadale TaxID=2026255 RepID=UPI001F0ACD86|nr:multicopper oxidase domain-containing protein [Corynebacterium hadale]
MARGINRRTFFRGIVLSSAAVLAACASGQPTPRGAKEEARPLPIPPLDQGRLVGGVREIELTAQEGHAEILPGVRTKTWGFNGDFLGPTLYMRNGETVRMTVRNQVSEPTVVHWHGMHLPADADGGPALAFAPGEQWQPEWTVRQDAATVWYHPHPHGVSALHAYRGLAGGIVIADDDADALGLPSTYGVDDIPVVITDAKFTDDGQLDETIDPTYGLLGDTPLINGITKPKLEAEASRLRLRLLNGTTMRFHNLSFGTPVHVIATDQGLLERPVEVDSILLSPGERAEVILDLEAGKTAKLRSIGVPDGGGLPDEEVANGFGLGDTFDLLEITGPASGSNGDLPSELAAAPEVSSDDVQAAVEREFRLNGFQINEQSMDMDRIDFVIDKEGPEVWTVTNENADWPHNFHIHNARFRVLGVEGGELAFTDGWHDTVYIPPLATVRLYVDIPFLPNSEYAFMYHCHMLFHEDEGMMGQFKILDRPQ